MDKCGYHYGVWHGKIFEEHIAWKERGVGGLGMKLNLQHLGKKKLLTKNSSHVCNNEIKDGKKSLFRKSRHVT